MPDSPDICPNCGIDVPEGSHSCPACGSDHNTGWNTEATRYDGVDLPEKSFDYDKYIEREEALKNKHSKPSLIDSVINYLKSIFFGT